MLAVALAITLLVAGATTLRGQASPILKGEVTEQRALQFAHAYLHDNAARIYPAPMPQN